MFINLANYRASSCIIIEDIPILLQFHLGLWYRYTYTLYGGYKPTFTSLGGTTNRMFQFPQTT